MANPPSVTDQRNAVVNLARGIVYFEGNEVMYNYKTGQWTRIPGWDGLGCYSTSGKLTDIGLIRFSSGSVDLQAQVSTYPALDAEFETGSFDLNQFGRSIITGIRPLVNGGTITVRAGVQDNLDDAVSWSAATTPNTRTNYANFRAEGRYVRAEVTITGGFTTAQGIDVEFSPGGKV